MTRIITTLLLATAASAAAQGTIQIGAITSLSGRFATFGQMQQAGFKVALDEVNARGGVNGQKVELAIEDDASDTNKALTAAEKLVNAKVPVVIGAYASGITKPLSQYMARVKVPLLVATAVDETITKPGNAYTFRVNNQSSVYTRSLIDQLRKTPGLKTAVILTSNDAFGKSVLTDATKLLPGAGYTILGKDTYDQGLTDFRPLLNRYKGQNPDVVIFASYEQDAVALTKQVKEVGLKPRIIAGIATGFALPAFLTGAADAAEGFLVTMVWNPDVRYPGAQNLYTRLKAALGGAEPSQHAAQSYAAMLAAIDAVKRAGGTDPEKVRAALAQTNLKTAFGPVAFRTYGGYTNQNSVVGLITQVQEGKFVTVGPASAARGKLILGK
ncbi:branched-chain amino acid transport system substrate-binding protein [Deinococcus metalli]|uniref:Branched-chain amino acid transport system substrate-binding protein n=1 Tax=Deinococcus metalli TaxID=1141878 RepID=A0A7W8KF49_9DEIO|nr:ABC transporter substrate-binding protein [Deinococcus metalli]MBB5375359.1 branched-chain amino acid transport system substrate-binding protein [Deinococcus metalli]GHF29891.1 ethanolamine utilization protein EutJ [Deinococcus metalli]